MENIKYKIKFDYSSTQLRAKFSKFCSIMWTYLQIQIDLIQTYFFELELYLNYSMLRKSAKKIFLSYKLYIIYM